MIRRMRRFWETVRHLRAEQVVHRLLKKIVTSVPLQLVWRDGASGVNVHYAYQERMYDGRDSFRFNNSEMRFDGSDWNDRGKDKLWLYKLHYQQWLVLPGCDTLRWINLWIDRNPPYSGNGWEPYPLSLRIVSWLKALRSKSLTPDKRILDSLAAQAGRLCGSLEYDLQANHLLENLLSLYTVLPLASHADDYAERIKGRLLRELDEQFLPDGAHYELSPMYHAILLERICDVLALVPDTYCQEINGVLKRTAASAYGWLAHMCEADNLALFNDACYSESATLRELGPRVASLTGIPATEVKNERCVHLAPSGYAVIRMEHCTFIMDVGRLGPDYQLGHAHCDMLSYSLWIDGCESIVDSGNYTYTIGEMRHYCRSTAAHNTVMLGDYEQAEIWASHRVGRRGAPVDVSVTDEGGVVRGRAGHTGYSHLKGRPIVYRYIEACKNEIIVTDKVESNGPQVPCRSFVHCAPGIKLIRDGKETRLGDNCLIRSDTLPEETDGWYCPEFGKKIRNKVLVFSFVGSMEYRIIIP